MARRVEPDHPTPGKFPALTYTYEGDRHRVECSCKQKAFCETTEALVARRFAQTHIGEHARLRIVAPLEALTEESEDE